jgi:hypothetical protein
MSTKFKCENFTGGTRAKSEKLKDKDHTDKAIYVIEDVDGDEEIKHDEQQSIRDTKLCVLTVSCRQTC